MPVVHSVGVMNIMIKTDWFGSVSVSVFVLFILFIYLLLFIYFGVLFLFNTCICVGMFVGMPPGWGWEYTTFVKNHLMMSMCFDIEK